jgi:superfamily II DNA or RNA helicase
MIEPDMKVRVRDDPSKIGVATEIVRETNGRTYRTVRLSDGQLRAILESRLEPMTDEPDAVADLAAVRLSAPEDLGRLLTHIRLTGGLADLIYSMEATNTEFHAYQFKPVLKILNSASKGLLIADEVGLGKTIEAGLIWTELAARYDVQRLLVVCPKSLQEKWRVELRSKFRVYAQPLDAGELLTVLKEAETRGGDFAVVATLSGVRAPRGWDDADEPAKGKRAELARYLSDRAGGDPIFDMVVFDEAHHLRNPETAQHRTARQMVELADYKLMLSATPINLKSEDLRSILRLVEPDLFDRESIFNDLQTENEPIVAARECVLAPKTTLGEVSDAIAAISPGRLLKTDRRIDILREQLAADPTTDTPARRADIALRLEEMSMLGGIVNRTRRRDVAEIQVRRRAICRTWTMSEVERDFYDRASEAIRQYALDADLNELFLLSNSQRLLASCLPAAYRRWHEVLADLDQEGDDDDEDDARSRKTPGPLVATLARECQDPSGADVLQANDTKFRVLTKALAETWSASAKEKLIIFSSFRGTLDYLEGRLQKEGVPCLKMHGSVKRARGDILADFEDTAGHCVLLTSEIGGEGLDLQFCRILINYDLPWNPMRVEQRIGRIDRIGQQSPSVEVFSLVCEGTIEARVYSRLYERLNLIERTLGGFEPILGDLIRELEGRLIDPSLKPEEQDLELDRAATAAETRKRLEDDLEGQAAGLIAHSDMILQRIKRAHDKQRWIQPRELYEYVKGGLSAAFPRSILDRAPVDYPAYDVRLCTAGHAAFRGFLDRTARRFETRLRRNESVRIAFSKKPEGVRDSNLEVVMPTHPLVRFIADLRDRTSGGLGARPAVFGSLALADVPASIGSGVYGLAIQRWSVEGITVQDKLVYSGIDLTSSEPMADDDAETLVGRAVTSLWPATLEAESAETYAEIIRNKLIDGQMTRAQEAFIAQEEAAHDDNRATLLAVLRHQLDTHRSGVEARIAGYLSDGGSRARIVPAERAKLEKYVARMNHRIETAELASNFEYDEPVTFGVVVLEVR